LNLIKVKQSRVEPLADQRQTGSRRPHPAAQADWWLSGQRAAPERHPVALRGSGAPRFGAAL